jgi:RNA recognition motif-containing protein
MKNIFVGNLDFNATDSSLRSLFEPYGDIARVNVVTDRDTGRSRGFAFVEMTDNSQADQAIAALNGVNLDGRALNVNEARPKTEGGGGGRGFGGGGQKRNRW